MHMVLIADGGPVARLMMRLSELGSAVAHGALSALVAAIVMLVGWLVARLISAAIRRVALATPFHRATQRAAGSGGVRRPESADVAGGMSYWLVITITAILAFEVLGLRLGTSVASRLGEIIPRVVTSGLLFVVGSFVALFAGGLTQRFLESVEVRKSRLQGQIVTVVVTGFAGLLALEQLGFAAHFVMSIGIVAAATAGAGLALAFGLGCRDLARDFLLEYVRSLEEEEPKRNG